MHNLGLLFFLLVLNILFVIVKVAQHLAPVLLELEKPFLNSFTGTVKFDNIFSEGRVVLNHMLGVVVLPSNFFHDVFDLVFVLGSAEVRVSG